MTKTAIQMIPIDSIKIANPRVRNARIHKSITENIDKVGLKRPITVRRLGDPADERYALVCGQGRLESFQMLGQAMVPAIIIDVDSETGYVMSIVENIARRTPRASEMMDQISNLQKRGYGDADIAKKIGYTTAWVNNVTLLLEKGERRLLAAAEAGHIPLNLAVEISRVSDSDAQMLLLEAYERGELKGKKISAARRILEQRIRSGKSRPIGAFGLNKPSKKLSTEELAKLYQEDTERDKLIQKKSEHAKNTILLAQQIFKELYADKEFCELLKSESLNSVPKPLLDFARSGGHL